LNYPISLAKMLTRAVDLRTDRQVCGLQVCAFCENVNSLSNYAAVHGHDDALGCLDFLMRNANQNVTKQKTRTMTIQDSLSRYMWAVSIFWLGKINALSFGLRTPSVKRQGSGSILRATTTDSSNVADTLEHFSPHFGGTLKRIRLEGEVDDIEGSQSFLANVNVPTFAAIERDADKVLPSSYLSSNDAHREGLEGVVPGAFVLRNALDPQDCKEMINCCEDLEFGNFNAGKNHHGALQLVVSRKTADAVYQILAPHMPPDYFDRMSIPTSEEAMIKNQGHVSFGLNRRWRVYRYDPGGEQSFAPHIDAGFPASGLSSDNSQLIWDDYPEEEGVVSRLTVLLYLNDDFVGGQTKFYTPQCQVNEHEGSSIIASVQPTVGAILVFPQSVGEESTDFARLNWPLHEGSPVHLRPNNLPTRPKYVIRSDVLFAPADSSFDENPDLLFQYDHLVRRAFAPQSFAQHPLFLAHTESLYNPVMGVENVGPFLYSFVRFTKVRRIVEIGAGYTSLWILQALKENDIEMNKIRDLKREGKCRLMDWPWTPEVEVETFDDVKASLLCVDNCLHQKETASGAAAVAKTLGLDEYFDFVQGDAYQMDFEKNSIDLLWCDFGVGSRIKDFAAAAWQSICPGGFLICHSSLTNQRTRDWVEAIRNCEAEDVTGLPDGEYVELSLLEPHKHYQNSISIIQKRIGYSEPVYSEYA
jgi:predicted O-methyltransferase YrrM